MISTYSRGSVTLTVERGAGADLLAFAITRTAPLTDDEVRRVNAELSDYATAQGAKLVQSPVTGEWEVRASGIALASDHGDYTSELRWTVPAGDPETSLPISHAIVRNASSAAAQGNSHG